MGGNMQDHKNKETFGSRIWDALKIPLIAIGVSLVVSGIIIAATGSNPFRAFYALLQGSGLAPKRNYAGQQGLFTDLMSYINFLTPMVFAALAVAAAMRVGLFNIGVSGQMLAAGITASALIGYSELGALVAKPLVILVGIIVGGLVGGLIGWLKMRFRINEVVSSIMLNYIIQYIVSFLIQTRYIDQISRQSKEVSAASRLTLMKVPMGSLRVDISIGILLALAAVAAMWVLFTRTTVGYEWKAIGLSPHAAKYAGMKVGKNLVAAMVLSGALAGLAGVTYYLGYVGSIQPKVLVDTGFDAIAVSLLGNNHPVGILFSTMLISVIGKGSTYMKSAAGVDSEIASVITGMILLFCACSGFLRLKLERDRSTGKSLRIRFSKINNKNGGIKSDSDSRNVSDNPKESEQSRNTDTRNEMEHTHKADEKGGNK
jgi:simple sugar transport system permease protein